MTCYLKKLIMFPSITNFITASNSLSAVLYFFSTIFPILVLIASLVYLLRRPRAEKGIFAPIENIVYRATEIFRVSLVVIAARFAAGLLKSATHIPRPFVTNPNLHPLFVLNDFSFPSQHATTFAALAVMLFVINRRAGLWAGAAALIIGSARVLAGVHTPIDILGGYLLGLIISLIVCFTIDRSRGIKDPRSRAAGC